LTGHPAENDVLVRAAGRALSRAGLVHAYGHCSQRLDERRFLVSAAKPLGMLAAGDHGVVVQVSGELPPGVLGEVRMHQRVYASRPDVGGVCRIQSPNLMTLSALGHVPRPRHGFGSYFWPQPPLWEDVQLVRDDHSAAAVAGGLGSAPAIVLRGNGAVVAGQSLMQAVVLSWYLEDAARVELDALRVTGEGPPLLLGEEECARRAVWSGGLAERMWDHLTAGDPELVRA
jgi:HCOMODA/2-hydroxy-3-carboxy-muconic semialdehyde decarboxylase